MKDSLRNVQSTYMAYKDASFFQTSDILKLRVNAIIVVVAT